MRKAAEKPRIESILSIEYISPNKIKENPKNSRKHPINQIKLIEKSIRRYGFTSPLLIDKKGFVLAGHGRLMAAKNLGISSIPVVRLSLSGNKAREYLIADNAIPMLSKWDKGILKFELDELKLGIDIGDLGISESAFNVFGMRKADRKDAPKPEKHEKKARQPKPHVCPNCHHVFFNEKEGKPDTRLTSQSE